nr:hypothetical protein Iba_chr04dCG14490 [Ipomoea batatas]
MGNLKIKFGTKLIIVNLKKITVPKPNASEDNPYNALRKGPNLLKGVEKQEGVLGPICPLYFRTDSDVTALDQENTSTGWDTMGTQESTADTPLGQRAATTITRSAVSGIQEEKRISGSPPLPSQVSFSLAKLHPRYM